MFHASKENCFCKYIFSQWECLSCVPIIHRTKFHKDKSFSFRTLRWAKLLRTENEEPTLNSCSVMTTAVCDWCLCSSGLHKMVEFIQCSSNILDPFRSRRQWSSIQTVSPVSSVPHQFHIPDWLVQCMEKEPWLICCFHFNNVTPFFLCHKKRETNKFVSRSPLSQKSAGLNNLCCIELSLLVTLSSISLDL